MCCFGAKVIFLLIELIFKCHLENKSFVKNSVLFKAVKHDLIKQSVIDWSLVIDN